MITLDERVAAGMRRQLASRAERLRAGERPLGWKVGFGSAAALARLGLDRALVGFLLRSNLLPDGAEASISGWAAPALEPEIAVHLARDVPPDASREAVRRAVGGLSAAIELADVDPPPTDVQEILAGNIFHRHVLLGPVREGWTTPEGVRARVLVNGDQVAATDDVTALTGETVDVVRLTAQLLEACGERLRAGEVVITGSVVPPLAVVAGQTVTVDLGTLGGRTVSLR
jgi:2-keto-4-pentenoate hydratase